MLILKSVVKRANSSALGLYLFSIRLFLLCTYKFKMI